MSTTSQGREDSGTKMTYSAAVLGVEEQGCILEPEPIRHPN